jgi:hypothetical protein
LQTLESFDVLFYKGKGVISSLIKRFTKSEYSHCAIVLDRYHLLETDWKYPASIKHLNYNSADYDIYRVTSLTDAQKAQLDDFLTAHLQSAYDYASIWERFLYVAFRKPFKRAPSTAYTCDELIVEAFKSVGVLLAEDDEKLSPGSLAKSPLLIKVKGS